jgi:hypothetical protein
MIKYILVALFAVVVLATGFQTSKADEEEVKLSECPKAVQKTLKREAKGGKIVEIEREVEDGETIYEAEIIIDGNEYEVEILEDGTLLSKILEDDEGDEDNEDGDDEDEEEDEEDGDAEEGSN